MSEPEDTAQAQEPPSKSQRKRDAHELQDLAEALLALPLAQLAKIPVPERLLDALDDTRQMRKHEALRRQKQYLGKVMRSVDAEPIRHALEKLNQQARAETGRFHAVEQWRDRLLSGGDDAVNALLQDYHGDRQHLRRLIRDAARETQHNKPPKSARALFKYLREIIAGDQH